jgi:hypothetical protein
VTRLPGAQCRLRHAHADNDLGVACKRFHVAARAARFLQHVARSVARQPLGQHRDCGDDARAERGDGAEQRMHEGDDGEVDRQPGGIEQRLDAAAAEEGAQLSDVAHGVGVDAPGGSGRLAQRVCERGRRKPPLERRAGPRECAGARGVHAIAQSEREQRGHAQHGQRLHAAAREHAVEYLHHVKRRSKQGDVEREARCGGEQHERSKVLREQPTHGRALPETCA